MSSARSSSNCAASTVINHIGSGGHNQVRGQIINEAGVDRHLVVVGYAEGDRTGRINSDCGRAEALGNRRWLQNNDAGVRSATAATGKASRSGVSKCGHRGRTEDLKE